MSAQEKPAGRAGRPMLRHGSATGGSFIQDHQQYRPPPQDHTIDSMLGDNQDVNMTDGIESNHSHASIPRVGSSSPSKIKDSGIVHSMSHRNCQPGPHDSEKLVATLFYQSQNPRHPHLHADGAVSALQRSPILATHLPAPEVPLGAAPTQDMAHYPLEPPPPEPEPLDHLYGPFVTQETPRVMDVTFSPAPSPEYITFDELRKHEAIWRFEREWNVEVVLQKENIWRKHKRLAVFDMDSTLIQQEAIDEIAKLLGVEDKVSAITSRAMNGELDFKESLKERVALLKGAPADVFERLKSVITITPGARELCKALKRLGFKTAVLSGGFTPLAEWLAADLDLDYAFANNLAISPDGKTLSGELDGSIVDAQQKESLLQEIAKKERIPLQQVIAVGDGANDLLMLKRAGLGIAFNAKSKVQLEAPARINTESLKDVLYILGFTKEEQDALLV